MKKSNKKGFILAETIVVSVVVLGALIFIYTQFISINRSYQRSFRYNSVDKLYAANNIMDFIKSEDITSIIADLTTSYVDITSCQQKYFSEYIYCEYLLDNLNVKKIIFTKEDTTDLKNSINTDTNISEELKLFIKNLAVNKEDNRYRIIVEFNDKTFASLKTDILDYTPVKLGMVVYFNPTTGNVCTDYVEDNSKVNNVNGCLKWYVYKSDRDSVGLLSDHHIGYYCPPGELGYTCPDGGTENLDNYYNNSVFSSYSPSVIKLQDIRRILKRDDIDYGTQIPTEFNWLYDRISIDCTKYGCPNNLTPYEQPVDKPINTFPEHAIGYHINTIHEYTVYPEIPNYYVIINNDIVSTNPTSSTDIWVRPTISINRFLVK